MLDNIEIIWQKSNSDGIFLDIGEEIKYHEILKDDLELDELLVSKKTTLREITEYLYPKIEHSSQDKTIKKIMKFIHVVCMYIILPKLDSIYFFDNDEYREIDELIEMEHGVRFITKQNLRSIPQSATVVNMLKPHKILKEEGDKYCLIEHILKNIKIKSDKAILTDEKSTEVKVPILNKQENILSPENGDEQFSRLLSEFHNIENNLEKRFSELTSLFEHKLTYDITKQQQIDLLHKELQEYKTDLIAKTNRPLVNGLIYLHSDIGKILTNLKSKPAEELTPECFLQAINNIQEDIDILLNQNSVFSFSQPTEKFEPKKQSILKNIPTSLPDQVGTIAERVAPGFEQGEDIIQKERVTVYVLDLDLINEQNEQQEPLKNKDTPINTQETK